MPSVAAPCGASGSNTESEEAGDRAGQGRAGQGGGEESGGRAPSAAAPCGAFDSNPESEEGIRAWQCRAEERRRRAG